MNPLLAQRIQAHNFRELFIDELGWDFTDNCIEFEINQRPFQYQVIAHKRGFAVLVGKQHRTLLADRHYLRRIQKRISRMHHEHIVIHFSERPAKQVWQWAIRTADGRKLRHREHPFFSKQPPVKLLERIGKLEFSLDEEDSVTLVDALDRVRNVLDHQHELELFAKRPKMAKQSDELAMAMKRGEPGAYKRFVEFHMKLAKKASRRIVRWFPGFDPEDAAQIAYLGLLEAAKRFEPERGYQFSTYAGYWIYQCCHRFSPDVFMPIRLPAHCFWDCFGAEYDMQRLIAEFGFEEAESRFKKDKSSLFPHYWPGFVASLGTRVFTDIERHEFFEARYRPDETQINPSDELIYREKCELLKQAMTFLFERDAIVLELRYGIGCSEHTLEEAGELLDVTRERVRQIQKRAEEHLRSKLYSRELEFFEALAVNETTEEDQMDESNSEDVVESTNGKPRKNMRAIVAK